jgi:hypothetical protein
MELKFFQKNKQALEKWVVLRVYQGLWFLL